MTVYELIEGMCMKHNIPIPEGLIRDACVLGMARSEASPDIQEEAGKVLDLVVEDLISSGGLNQNTRDRISSVLVSYARELGKLGINLSLKQ